LESGNLVDTQEPIGANEQEIETHSNTQELEGEGLEECLLRSIRKEMLLQEKRKTTS